MQKALFHKALIAAALTLALLVPLGSIQGLVLERQARQRSVVEEVAASIAGVQTMGGPVLAMPYSLEWTETVMEDLPVSGATPPGTKVRREYQRRVQGRRVILPTLAEWDTRALTEHKRRGLFKALVYDLDASVAGRFDVPGGAPRPDLAPDVKVTWGTPFLSLRIADTRGLSSTPRLTLDGRPLDFRNGSGLAALPEGIRAELDGMDLAPGAPGTVRSLPFALHFSVRGTQELSFAPLAETTAVKLTSPWPHPSFGGSFLPTAKDLELGAEGFTARWEIASLAAKAPAAFSAAAAEGRECQGARRESFGVRLVEPVNVYSMADRALKYGLRFVGLSFSAFFLFELFKRLRIHPAQYMLVGLALALFFLMLLGLSEHIPFGLAYGLAALACVGLQGYYVSHVLGGAARGRAFAGLLGALFAALYGLLISEDLALLMGSLLLFGLLALAMTLTRKLDWYSLGLPEPATQPPTLQWGDEGAM